ncbi:NPP1 family protein [Nonomuraea sp. NPDC050547]|uniref:NPP1 family protein n=1 Tax=Nonomuraea sp. NPDC050547 TaxID=3364368 RepID=UPI00379AD8E8
MASSVRSVLPVSSASHSEPKPNLIASLRKLAAHRRRRPDVKIRKSRILLTVSMVLALSAVPGVAFAAPPAALPPKSGPGEWYYQPAYDYDKDGCYPTPAIGRDGTVASGLEPADAFHADCQADSDLRNTNGYSRYKCNNGWCAFLYALYFEMDQAALGTHKHDWEHVVVWVARQGAIYVSTSAHGKFTTYHRSQVQWIGAHPKIVYHRGGVVTHSFRLARKGEQPENHAGRWQYPSLVGWDSLSPNLRGALNRDQFSPAQLDLRDARFSDALAKAKPPGIPFNPYA